MSLFQVHQIGTTHLYLLHFDLVMSGLARGPDRYLLGCIVLLLFLEIGGAPLSVLHIRLDPFPGYEGTVDRVVASVSCQEESPQLYCLANPILLHFLILFSNDFRCCWCLHCFWAFLLHLFYFVLDRRGRLAICFRVR